MRREKKRTYSRLLCVLGLVLAGTAAVLLPTCSGKAHLAENVDPTEFVLPKATKVDPTLLAELAQTVSQGRKVPGLPDDLMAFREVRIELTPDLPPRAKGKAYAKEGLIRLPLDIGAWGPAERTSVIRHELAHISLGAYLAFKNLPPWFDEGFAVWASGGVDCKAEARVRLDLMVRDRFSKLPPDLFGLAEDPARPLATAYWGLFFDFLEWRDPGIISEGLILQAVRERDLLPGFRHALGVELSDLETEWQAHLITQFGQVPRHFSCTGPEN